MTFVVQVRDHDSDGNEFSLYGPFRSGARAHEFTSAVCAEIEQWCVDNADEHGPQETDAWAYVLPLIHERHVEEAMVRAFGDKR